MITSTSNKKIKDIIALIKKRSLRDKTKTYVIEGIKIFEEIPFEDLKEVFISETFLKNSYKDLKEETKHKLNSIKYELVSDIVFNHTSDTKTPQGILAVAKRTEYSLEKLLEKDISHAIIILDDIQDPGNLVTIVRSSEAAGISLIIMSKDTVDIYNPKVIRSTMGSIFRVPFVYVDDINVTIKMLKQKNIKIYTSTLSADKEYDKEDYTKSSAFIIGNESRGVKSEIIENSDICIKIPMLGKTESLNVGVASSIFMFELARQRR